MDRNSQVAIITGAGSGIGRATAELLAAEGLRLALVGRTPGKLQQTLELISALGIDSSQLMVVPADISHQADANFVIDQTMNRWNRIDVLVNNAAALHVAPIGQANAAAMSDTFAINVFGPLYLLAHAWPVFQRQGSGCVVNISSMSSVDPFPGLSIYAASKCAMESIARSIRTEDQTHSIRAFNIAPGAVETDMLRSFVPESNLSRSRALQPHDVAQVILECVQGRRNDEQGRTILLTNR